MPRVATEGSGFVFRPISFMSIALLVGCVSTAPNIQPNKRIVDFPEGEGVHAAQVGEALVRDSVVYVVDAYRLLQAYERKGGGGRFTASPGIYAAERVDGKGTYYMSVGNLVETCGFGSCSYGRGGFIVGAKLFEISDSAPIPVALKQQPVWEKVKHVIAGSPTFSREILYNGRAGDVLRLSYREFQSDLARPAFTQELSYDMSEGRTVGFQGVRIDVLEATNTVLRYKVLSRFRQRD